jgi:RNA polymerase sigma-70 factor (ECF subfamily)
VTDLRRHVPPVALRWDDEAPGTKGRVVDGTLVFVSLYPGLRRLAAVVGPPEDDPDDLVQEAVVGALRSGPLTGLANPRAYLSASIVHLASNRRRSLGRRRRAVSRLAADDAPLTPVYPSDLALLQRLSPVDRAVLYLTAVEGATAKEVAALIGGSPAAIRVRRTRALRRLRTAMQKDDLDG